MLAFFRHRKTDPSPLFCTYQCSTSVRSRPQVTVTSTEAIIIPSYYSSLSPPYQFASRLPSSFPPSLGGSISDCSWWSVPRPDGGASKHSPKNTSTEPLWRLIGHDFFSRRYETSFNNCWSLVNSVPDVWRREARPDSPLLLLRFFFPGLLGPRHRCFPHIFIPNGSFRLLPPPPPLSIMSAGPKPETPSPPPKKGEEGSGILGHFPGKRRRGNFRTKQKKRVGNGRNVGKRRSNVAQNNGNDDGIMNVSLTCKWAPPRLACTIEQGRGPPWGQAGRCHRGAP